MLETADPNCRDRNTALFAESRVVDYLPGLLFRSWLEILALEHRLVLRIEGNTTLGFVRFFPLSLCLLYPSSSGVAWIVSVSTIPSSPTSLPAPLQVLVATDRPRIVQGAMAGTLINPLDSTVFGISSSSRPSI